MIVHTSRTSSRRLLVVTESLGVGGTESHLLRLLPRLSTYGWDIAVFCLTARGRNAGQMTAAGIQVFGPDPDVAPAAPQRDSAHIIKAAARLFRVVKKWRPLIVHFYLPGPYLVGAPISLAAGVPIKVMSRRCLSHYQERRPISAKLEHFLHQRMNAVIGNSQAVVRDLTNEGLSLDKITLIYNGIETGVDFFDRREARRALGLDANALVGVMVANLIPYKGHRTMIEGISSVSQRLPSGWKILCAGRDEGLRVELEQLAESRGVKANFEFIGERTDIPQVLAAADFGILSSEEEGFSNAVLEGMSAGLPMVVTAVGGNAEALRNEETGLIVPPKDPFALGKAVLRLAGDPELRKDLGRAACNSVMREFSIDNCVGAHNLLYNKLSVNGPASLSPPSWLTRN